MSLPKSDRAEGSPPAFATQGLSRIGDPQALPALVGALLVVRRIVEANPRLGAWDALAAKLGPIDPRAPPPMRVSTAVDPATGEARFQILE